MLLQQATFTSFWPNNFADWGAGIGAIISGIALLLLVIQVLQTRSEMNNKLRPWISVSHVNFYAPDLKIENPTVNVEFEYTNYGDIPAIDLNPNVKWSTEVIDISEKMDNDRLLTLMPQQKSFIGIAIPSNLFHDIELGKKQLYVLVSLIYISSRDGKNHYIKLLYIYHTTGKVLNIIKCETDNKPLLFEILIRLKKILPI